MFANLKPGDYKGYARDSNNCTAQSDMVSIYNLCVRFSLEIKNSTCGQSSGSITINTTSGVPPFLYSINGGNYQTSNIFPNLNSEKYVITVKDKENKTATNNAEIITTPPPQINLVASATSCSNNDGVILASVKNGIAPFLYRINNSSFTPDNSFRGLSIGNHFITVKDSSGCTSSANISIPLKDNSKLFAGNDTNAVINYPLQLNAIDINNSGFIHYTWSPPTGLNDPAIANPVATLNNNTTYTVTASNAIGCKASDVIKIEAYIGPEIYVPTAFTPNHDGLNDKLNPIPVGIKKFLFFEIYSRWGEMVFYTTNANKAWDGTIQGVKIIQGTYVWFAQGYDVAGKLVKRKGTVTLIH
ncbi:MAG TPA: gliding motility-associated C-terminal domain-containing protein [Parafilimonas sp.]|nr:gliding motility-associated C-terminal domain-containing protein [Parafilimonas sp.]